MKLSQKVLEIACNEIGKSEKPKGSNWGNDVKKYLASVGIKFPAPWCAAFVYWCVNEACNALKIDNPLFQTGGVMMQRRMSKKLVVKSNPQPGDLFVMDFGGGKGHIGFVDTVDNESETIGTIEGNSNDEGSREGYEVCRKPGGRKMSTILCYIRLDGKEINKPKELF